jgi:glycosyltransferase involved in cell wall biosynthesis
MNITLIIPAHNEEAIIQKTIEGIEERVRCPYALIVVNDHSTDHTADVVRGLMKRYANLRLVDNDTGKGFADALRKGFSMADTAFAIPVMADLCDDPDTINVMEGLSVRGYDIICGSRYMKGGSKNGGPFLQSCFSRFVGVSLHHLIRIPTVDISNSFKCYRTELIRRLKTESRAFEFSMELTLKAYFSRAKITEVPTAWKGRDKGKSKFYITKVAWRYMKLYLWAIAKKYYPYHSTK